jgi:hypothetical protein
MSTSILNDHIKKKIERYAEYTGRPVNEVLDDLIPEVPAPAPAPEGRSVKGLLEGKLDNLEADADFEGLHQDMLKRYGSDAE